MENLKPFQHFATNAIHAGQEPEQWACKAVVPMISMSTTFKQEGPGQHCGYEYSRSGNPTRNCLEQCIASIEGAKYGMVFSSGLATTTAITHLLKVGDHIVSMNDLYGGTNRYFKQVASRNGIETSFVDCTVPEKVAAAIKPNTRMVWMETPTNPTMQLVDIEAVVNVVKKVKAADQDIFVVVDNTFMSSYFQRPLSLGADIVMHSLTKYMNGHSDSVMGALATNNQVYSDRLRFLQNAFGPVPSPFDCYLVNRGLKTLHVRMKEHMKNGLAVAHFLEKHPCVVKVIHPGLPSHPQHELAKRQMRGFSGMVSFYIKGGLNEASIFLKKLKVFTLAESLGGFESLAELPSVMTHASVPAEEREQLGITDNLIRLSVGLEDEVDLLDDLDQALKSAAL
ncbi:cystathionine gamma-lyase-like [Mizuhopecten yessoensis]|uniref:cystathionine gamma-lyase n=1 Tax=Mizuhopecten yessoensis TaxID=6573 RepID=A0A210PGA8_MIZYE|nr:cystathionine gamma-lyase-like [Mizuhopecten yessoensis]OWF35533.1 Cystathionine gamma-lyase [Mizuhopecten yessoensis]